METVSLPKLIMEDKAAGTFRLNGDAFVDPQIFEVEMKRLFEESWLYLGHESLVPANGDYITLNLGRQPVILVRDDKGKLHCILNRCRHRGATVCRSVSGNSTFFRCFYHGWSYKNDGTLIGIPDRAGYPKDFDETSLSLIEIPRIENYKGFLFTSFSKNPPPLKDYLGRARVLLDIMVDKYPDGIEAVRGGFRYGFKGNWKLYVENNVDLYHAPILHKSFYDIAGLTDRASVSFVGKNSYNLYLGDGQMSLIYAYPDDPKVASEGFQSSLKKEMVGDQELLARLGPVGAKWAKKITGFHLFVPPNLFIFEGEPPSPQIRVISPIAVNETEVVNYSYVPKGCDEKTRKLIIRVYERGTGPGSHVSPDDMEALNCVADACRAKIFPWNDLSKGTNREQTDSEIRELLDFERAGHPTDDTHLRGFYKWWAGKLSRS